MLENTLVALVRSTLLTGLAARGLAGVAVERNYQPTTVGMPAEPTLLISPITRVRYGSMQRKEIQPVAPATDLTHEEVQWWETMMQVGGLAHRKPTEIALPTAMDLVSVASDILQGDAGLLALGAQRVRPLRITAIRNPQFVNDSDQYEAYPSFDIVLSHVQITASTTPPVAQFEPDVGRV